MLHGLEFLHVPLLQLLVLQTDINFVDVALNLVEVVENIYNVITWAQVVGLDPNVIDSSGLRPCFVVTMGGISYELIVFLQNELLEAADARVIGGRTDEAEPIARIDPQLQFLIRVEMVDRLLVHYYYSAPIDKFDWSKNVPQCGFESFGLEVQWNHMVQSRRAMGVFLEDQAKRGVTSSPQFSLLDTFPSLS